MGKRRLGVWLAILALAVVLCPGVAFAVDGVVQATLLQAQDVDLPNDLGDDGYHVVLDGNEGLWLQYYLDDKDATVSPNAELYYGDTLVDAGLYDLKWQVNWYDDAAGKDCYEDVALPVRYVSHSEAEGEYSGIGDNYEVFAVPAEGSPLKGESKRTTVMPVDKSSFNYHAKRVVVEGAHEAFVVPSWHDQYAMAPGVGAGIRVFDSAVNSAGAVIDPQYYTVTYYNRKPGPYNTDDPNYGEDVWVKDNPLAGFPTEPGTYFAVVEGKAPYFGWTVVDFDIVEGYVYADVRLERVGDDMVPLFNDGEAQFEVNAEAGGVEGTDWQLVVRIGQVFTFDNEAGVFEHPLVEGKDFTFDKEAGLITIDGAKAWEALSAWMPGPTTLVVRARVVKLGTNDVLAEAVERVECREAQVEYDFDDMEDRDMLPGWDGRVDRWYSVHVENAQYADGWFDYEVIDVAVDNDAVLDLRKEYEGDDESSDDYWWRYEACEDGYGAATVTVTYQDPDELGGEVKTRSFEVNVTHDVYGVDVDAKDPETGAKASKFALPGGSIQLRAHGWHDIDYDVVEEEPLSYEWTFDYGEEDATIAVDPEDSEKATVTFRTLGSDEDEDWADVKVRVTMYGQEDGKEVERASNDIELHMNSDYVELAPAGIDEKQDVGTTQDVALELRNYRSGVSGGYEVIEGATFRVDDFDENAVQILDANGHELGHGDEIAGGTFTIKRLTDQWTDFKVWAEWNDGEYVDRWYQLEGMDYNIWFDEDDYQVYDDNAITLAPNTENLGNLAYAIEYEVGDWDGDEEGWQCLLEEGKGYTVDGASITIDGAAIKKADLGGVNVHAIMKPAVEGVGESDAWCSVELRESCGDHRWLEDVTKLATCDEPGSKDLVCENCGEVRTEVIPALGHDWGDWTVKTHATCTTPGLEERVCARDASHKETREIPALGHALVKTAAVAATCEAAGNIEYWTCSTCGELFADEAATKPVAKADTVVAALGHDWGEPTYVWADDNGSVTAKRVCARDAAHVQTETTVTEKAVKDATYDAPGEITYTATFKNGAFKAQQKVVEIPKLEQLDQPMKVSASAKALKAKDLKKKAKTIALIKVSNAQGTVSYAVASANAKSKKALKLNAKTGKVTVKKGTKKGKYQIKVKVTASGNEQYAAGSKTVTVKVTVK